MYIRQINAVDVQAHSKCSNVLLEKNAALNQDFGSVVQINCPHAHTSQSAGQQCVYKCAAGVLNRRPASSMWHTAYICVMLYNIVKSRTLTA